MSSSNDICKKCQRRKKCPFNTPNKGVTHFCKWFKEKEASNGNSN